MAKKKKAKARSCAGVVKSGAKKGRLKKGYKWPGGGKCPVKVTKKKGR
jgi:hypothetical protein